MLTVYILGIKRDIRVYITCEKPLFSIQHDEKPYFKMLFCKIRIYLVDLKNLND